MSSGIDFCYNVMRWCTTEPWNELCGVLSSDWVNSEWPLCDNPDCRLVLLRFAPHPERERRFWSTRPVWAIVTPGSCANPLQFIQNCKKVQLLFNLLEFFHAAELLRTLHWLLKSDSKDPACHPVNSSDPSETRYVAKPVHPSESSTANQLATPSLRGWPSYRSTQSRPLAVLTPQWWNELPIVFLGGFF